MVKVKKIIRYVPIDEDRIIHYAKTRNPFNHMTVMFRASAIKKVDGYDNVLFFEDYDLWVRMIQAGCRVKNLDEILVYTYESGDIYKRRGGISYLRYEIGFQRIMYRMGFISLPMMIMNIVLRSFVRVTPHFLRKWIYKNLLRKKH